MGKLTNIEKESWAKVTGGVEMVSCEEVSTVLFNILKDPASASCDMGIISRACCLFVLDRKARSRPKRIRRVSRQRCKHLAKRTSVMTATRWETKSPLWRARIVGLSCRKSIAFSKRLLRLMRMRHGLEASGSLPGHRLSILTTGSSKDTRRHARGDTIAYSAEEPVNVQDPARISSTSDLYLRTRGPGFISHRGSSKEEGPRKAVRIRDSKTVGRSQDKGWWSSERSVVEAPMSVLGSDNGELSESYGAPRLPELPFNLASPFYNVVQRIGVYNIDGFTELLHLSTAGHLVHNDIEVVSWRLISYSV
ncbi:hypothetical protein F5Y18DRAFT_421680 [Xylariaceae sp. FL1019]|nr:hypothetical protein F5Y18DRAFT_421680 [Xylariaceae sp. FL1019]